MAETAPRPTILEALEHRVLVLDGAMGTQIHDADLTLDDFDGLENCSEILCTSRPDVIRQIHAGYLAAGADVVETNTFGGMPHVLVEFDIQDRVHEINRAAVRLAREAALEHETPDRPRYVLGAIGPGTKLVTLGQITFDDLVASYRAQAEALIEGGPPTGFNADSETTGVDAVLVETCQDILQIKAVVSAIIQAQQHHGLWNTDRQVPIFVSITIEQQGTMLVGSDITAAVNALADLPIAGIGMNCATGPKEMTEHLRYLGANSTKHVTVYPNAGLPTLQEGRTVFPMQPGPFAEQVGHLAEEIGISLVGGCCGTTPAHIAAIAERVRTITPKKRDVAPEPGCSSLYRFVEYRQQNTTLNVGERCNASGSRRFKRLLEEEDWDQIVSLAREQMREGSHMLDVNVDYAGRDNASDMSIVVEKIVRQVDAPLMLDSTNPDVIEAGLKKAGGKCVLNSANLEDGEEKFAHFCQLAKTYGAALVLGTIDEDPEEAMARTADRKLSIAARMHALATETYGLAEDDLMFDPLVLPISTGMEKDRRSALETIEGTRRIAERFPKCQITCGLSNVSFGLKPAARQVLNSAFLHELVQAGMTSAILHISKILPRTKIPDYQWNAALNLIYDRRDGKDALPVEPPEELMQEIAAAN
ncbi:MAG: homocysteine S-methyltransferase family protein [Planctomycetota bacterium]